MLCLSLASHAFSQNLTFFLALYCFALSVRDNFTSHLQFNYIIEQVPFEVSLHLVSTLIHVPNLLDSGSIFLFDSLEFTMTVKVHTSRRNWWASVFLRVITKATMLLVLWVEIHQVELMVYHITWQCIGAIVPSLLENIYVPKNR